MAHCLASRNPIRLTPLVGFVLMMAAATQVQAATSAVVETGMSVTAGANDVNFGSALSLDASTLVVGAYGSDRVAGTNPGSVTIYKRAIAGDGSGTWTFDTRLTNPVPGTNDSFGYSVALGNGLLAIGAPDRSFQGTASKVFVYNKNGSTWNLTATLTDTSSQGFGQTVGFSQGRLLVKSQYRIACYTWNGTQWNLASSISNQNFVNFSVSGDRMVCLGQTGLNTAGGQAAYVYAVTASNTMELEATVPFSVFTAAVALSGDRFVIGGYSAFSSQNAIVYARNNAGTWAVEQLLPAADSVAMDGNRIALGRDTGTVRILDRTGGTWSEIATFSGTSIGARVALSSGLVAAGGGNYFTPANHQATVRRLVSDGLGTGAALSIARNGSVISSGTTVNAAADFGDVAVFASQQRSFTLSNTGNAALTMTGTPLVTLSGPDADSFAVQAQPASAVMAPGTQQSFVIQAAPQAVGLRTAFATISWSGQVSILALSVNGTSVVSPRLAIDSAGTPLAYSTITSADSQYLQFFRDHNYLTATNGSADLRTITIRNAGTSPLTITSMAFEDLPGSPASAAMKSYLTLSALSASVLQPGESATATLTWRPTGNGGTFLFQRLRIVSDSTGPDPQPFITAFRFYSDTANGANGSITVLGNSQTIGDGDLIPSLADFTDFGSTAVAGGTVTRTFAVKNLATSSQYNYPNTTVVISGNNAADFSPASPTINLPNNTTVNVPIIFNPSASGLRTATVVVTTDFGRTHTFAIQGTGTVNTVPVPTAVVLGKGVAIASGDTTPSATDGTDFGSLAVNASGFADFVISNTGDATLALSGSPRVAISGSPAFTVIQQPVLSSIVATGTDTFRIRYLPTATGSATATVTIANNDAARPAYTFVVTGSSVAATQSIVHFASDSVQIVPAAAGTAILTVVRDTGISQAATVSWQTVAGTAIAGSEFTASAGTISFAAGEVAKQISIAIRSGAVTGHVFSVQLASTDATVSLTAPSSAQIQFGAAGGGTTNNPGDLNGDKVVNITDLTLVTSHFSQNSSHPNWNPLADSNGDGVVNITDLTAVTSHFSVTYP